MTIRKTRKRRTSMETILIVDDEKNYLVILEDMLSDAGYHLTRVY